ncbi:MAG: hypothetical protein KUA35_05940 [Pseudodesulfovibrio sp.]|uniref:N-acetyltransferase domain-containing protein n=1 Tax=Pseudodesulfovibrio aespoeensis (strain ATCC 700646 / DSM 10631 / Aspo-2) TaxID=643562 RepID=E6VYQ6_PSEA9|nr:MULTISPECIES: hypothetical protein [Pseudodesulfovibrio]MBU4377666.1 hypothetical protein [Pseudomonadota bacterium]ADU63923.1 hypothetical protein Daes_2929 [Pseudodesulfovibrio aespoeensis Aspo-2]MBU4517360.1 hypothetical protein [Pseudomonadota bacterium]MBU4523031.1 hypothetical protein [Pseudomonadota bacterium]MBU4560272.1 hypothetical protein [Pseudomonadota bacterium]
MKTRKDNLAQLCEEGYVVEPGQKFVVDDFRPGDALGVARLYYRVYGDMFPIDHVYDPQELARINAGDDLYQAVGRTDKGDIVGLYALFRNPPGRKIMEAGSWIVHPDYRTTSLGLRLARKIHNKPPEHLGLDVISGQCVCDHLTTQKLGKVVGACTCALEIEPMPPRPISEGGAYGRISLLDQFCILHDRPHDIFLPTRYADALRAICEGEGLTRTFVEDVPPQSDTVASTLVIEDASLAKLTVEAVGVDFARHLAEMERAKPDMHVYQLVLPLWRPGCSLAVEAARARGYFFGGLLPQWYDRDGLLLQKVAGTPDFDKIKLFSPQGQGLLDIIRADWQSLHAGG